MARSWSAKGLLKPLWGRVGGRDALAALTGIPGPNLSGYNTGRLRLGEDAAAKIAAALGVTPADLGRPDQDGEEPSPLLRELVALREVIEGAVAHRDKWQNRLEKRIDRQLSSQERLLARLTELADALADRQQALQNVTANLESAATNLATVADRLETASRARPPQSQARKKA